MIRLIALAGAAMLFLATAPVVAADNTDPTAPTQQGTGFVDKDGDGICDTYTANGGKGCCAAGKGKGAGFVDANKDGVCDKAATGKGCGMGNGQGKGKAQGKAKKGCCSTGK